MLRNRTIIDTNDTFNKLFRFKVQMIVDMELIEYLSSWKYAEIELSGI